MNTSSYQNKREFRVNLEYKMSWIALVNNLHVQLSDNTHSSNILKTQSVTILIKVESVKTTLGLFLGFKGVAFTLLNHVKNIQVYTNSYILKQKLRKQRPWQKKS